MQAEMMKVFAELSERSQHPLISLHTLIQAEWKGLDLAIQAFDL
jgi:hypothetical protein